MSYFGSISGATPTLKLAGDIITSGNIVMTSPVPGVVDYSIIYAYQTGAGPWIYVNGGIVWNNLPASLERNRMAFGSSAGPLLVVFVNDNRYTVAISTSDYRIKENIRPTNNVLDRLCSINMFDYTLKRLPELLNENQDKISNQLGFFAHEFQEMFPEYEGLVDGDKDELNQNGNMRVQQINSFQFGNILMKSIQEQNAEVNQLKIQLQEQNAEVNQLNAEVNQLKIQLQEQNEKFNQLILTTQTLQAEIQELKSANNTLHNIFEILVIYIISISTFYLSL